MWVIIGTATEKGASGDQVDELQACKLLPEASKRPLVSNPGGAADLQTRS